MPQIIRNIAQTVSLHQEIHDPALGLALPGAVDQRVKIHVCTQHILIQREYTLCRQHVILIEARLIKGVVL